MVWQKGSLCLLPQLTANRTLNQSRLIHRDGCSLSCKDGAVVWQSSEQLAAGCLTILEMLVDDCRCPHSLIHFEAISVNFIMWSLCFTILTEFSLGFLSGDHTCAHSFNEVSLGIVIVCSWLKAGCPQEADEFGIDLCRGHDCFYLETNGRGRRSGHASSPIWPECRSLVVWSNSRKAWYAGLSMHTSFQIGMHG